MTETADVKRAKDILMGRCRAVKVVGGGKKARGRGYRNCKYHCRECRVSFWSSSKRLATMHDYCRPEEMT